MSYEGFWEYMCKKGHYWTEDCHLKSKNPKCPECKKSPKYYNSVDETNGYLLEYDRESFASWPAQKEVVNVLVKTIEVKTNIYSAGRGWREYKNATPKA